ncbi:MAG: excinuclease ABC subunit UvrA [Bacteroidales bacterium]|jgi:excinuclease ABC subunit A|nr:excinuclease ABC subunit UvrA [Bacteroidales bacterium]MCI2121385.1 excinuclease ABC subunit UvrA [Bacteroidales bacterium]MCI2145496.1 excinuclease ABC subunit UvrA [Bacteroidales bacterium]
MKQDEFIHIRGARVNNLKNVSLDIPRDKLVVITGISGSGKSSLAFDTIFAEGQRRFAESLSSFARQFLGRMVKPDVDIITGIPPAIAIRQKVTTVNSRSTVGTTTEINDFLRLLFARIGRTYSPVTGREVKCDTAQGVAKDMLSFPKGTVTMLLSDIGWSDAASDVEQILALKSEGFNRLFDAGKGEIVKMDDVLQSMRSYLGLDVWLLVDRFAIAPEDDDLYSRMLDSLQTAFEKGGGRIAVWHDGELRRYSNVFEADGMSFMQPSERMFNFNNPLGACPACEGFGKVMGIDERLVIPDQSLSVYQGAVACWHGEIMDHFRQEVVMRGYMDFPVHRPYRELEKEQKNLLWNGNEHFTGINRFFEWVDSQKYKIQFRYLKARYSGKTECPACKGTRLRKESLWVKVGGKNIAELCSMTVEELYSFFMELQGKLDVHDASIAKKPVEEIISRLQCMIEVGLPYMTLDRSSNTLSGGESQRINLVTSLGNNLVGSMYILDEPSVGLHSRDTQKLIAVLKRLRDLGNTVIVVEHDEQIIKSADWLIDIGPYAGINGGEVVYRGPVSAISSATRSLTADYLTGKRTMGIRDHKRTWSSYIEVSGATNNNLKNIDVRFPLGCITAVTGVSGSGKSSLVGDILYPAIYRRLNEVGNRPGAFRELKGNLSRITQIEYVDQNPIGKSTRSNPVTYLKVYDDIRKLFSEQPYARMNGYGHSHFSFNIDGGRCPVCQGEGVIKIEMQFMADVKMVCEACGGKRFLPDILEVKFDGKNINDVLNLSVDEAVDFFGSHSDPTAKRIAERLRPLQDVGLGYVQLGQSSSSLSGGESQRIKLASFLGKGSESGSIMFIFDEPTTGLHFYDIKKLLDSFNALVDRGNTIVVVEHNLDVIAASDWVIDLGPDAGSAGGYLDFAGKPEELAQHTEFPTGAALKEHLSRSY